MAELSYTEISALLKYEPETGKFYWLPRTPDMFPDETKFSGGNVTRCKTWNSRYAGKEAFTGKHCRGYLQAGIMGYSTLAHRVAWVFITGDWPLDQIDHINGNRADNRADNLRAVSNQENSRNMTLSKRNKTGVCGVCWNQGQSKWMASIRFGGRNVNLGLYDDFSLAVKARKDAEVKYGFHPGHGKERLQQAP